MSFSFLKIPENANHSLQRANSKQVEQIEDKEEKCKILAEILETEPQNVCLAIDIAKKEGVDPLLFLALIYTESNFKENALSPKGYHGLAQIPWKIPWPDINLTIGARILKEKMLISGNNTVKALMLYKGYPLKSQRGYKKSVAVLKLRKYLQLALAQRSTKATETGLKEP